MTGYELTAAAWADLDAIAQYIQQDDPIAANRVIDRIQGAVRALGAFPLVGHTRADLTSRHVRFLSVGSYVIVYRHDVRPVQILRVLHAARDLPTLLDGDRGESADHVSECVVTESGLAAASTRGRHVVRASSRPSEAAALRM